MQKLLATAELVLYAIIGRDHFVDWLIGPNSATSIYQWETSTPVKFGAKIVIRLEWRIALWQRPLSQQC